MIVDVCHSKMTAITNVSEILEPFMSPRATFVTKMSFSRIAALKKKYIFVLLVLAHSFCARFSGGEGKCLEANGWNSLYFCAFGQSANIAENLELTMKIWIVVSEICVWKCTLTRNGLNNKSNKETGTQEETTGTLCWGWLLERDMCSIQWLGPYLRQVWFFISHW